VSKLVQTVSAINASTRPGEGPLIAQQVQLSEIALLASKMSDEYSFCEADVQFIWTAAGSASLCNTHRATAQYTLGLLALKKARASGDLQEMWSGENQEVSQLLRDAQRHFGSALGLLGPASDVLTRNVQRCLALASGRGDESSETVFELIHASIGRSTRRAVVTALGVNSSSPADRKRSDGDRVAEVLSCLDNPANDIDGAESTSKFSFEEFAERIPRNSRFLAFALCPTGELLVTASAYSESTNALRFITECLSPKNDNGDPASMYDLLLTPIDRIVQRNQDQLSGSSDSTNDFSLNDEETKRVWWSQRNGLDSELQDLLDTVEQQFFSSEPMRRLLFGPNDAISDKTSCTNLASRFEEICKVQAKTDGVVDPCTLCVSDLRQELLGCGIELSSLRRMKKAELVQMAIEERRRAVLDRARINNPFYSESFIFLILDENLQRFPFESMRCFDGRAVSRIPSLPFALAKFTEALSLDGHSLPIIDCSRVSYVLDPEGDLGFTQDRLAPIIDTLSDMHGSRWKGTVGHAPTFEFMEEALTRKNGMLLFFGHGGGQKNLPSTKIAGLIGGGNAKSRRAEASVVLMGCSSARLESVNRKGSKTEKEVPIHFEPEGIALSYICAGAPCVVGNLWDVTDHDIDRFAMSFLKGFFELGGNRSIPQCVADARSACKLRHIVGCAPVCYGVPVFKAK
jgi:hypothetical protein